MQNATVSLLIALIYRYLSEELLGIIGYAQLYIESLKVFGQYI